ncbi:hypothetical protein QQP08_014290 [Theobroma cacao]|nr:hypothetical protein QQP08_014290 [Theobroma cacao]
MGQNFVLQSTCANRLMHPFYVPKDYITSTQLLEVRSCGIKSSTYMAGNQSSSVETYLLQDRPSPRSEFKYHLSVKAESIVRDFCLNQELESTFTPSPSASNDSCALINAIEIVSMSPCPYYTH